MSVMDIKNEIEIKEEPSEGSEGDRYDDLENVYIKEEFEIKDSFDDTKEDLEIGQDFEQISKLDENQV
ncbi:hypothetical protein Anas_10681 [Armadillidium nasatum]|uniref:Uncharacterized protein n=1 Tax=Armadillidium nasatum TaxID=96803 RepID=A0A5N5TG07_9CRUS|nr:hypothetical protein Anas_10681 [Armadillidium nasatum]